MKNMTYHGQIRNGSLVLDEPVALLEGSVVECVLFPSQPGDEKKGESRQGLYDDLLEFAGKATGLPDDASENVDHYLYGLPRK